MPEMRGQRQAARGHLAPLPLKHLSELRVVPIVIELVRQAREERALGPDGAVAIRFQLAATGGGVAAEMIVQKRVNRRAHRRDPNPLQPLREAWLAAAGPQAAYEDLRKQRG